MCGETLGSTQDREKKAQNTEQHCRPHAVYATAKTRKTPEMDEYRFQRGGFLWEGKRERGETGGAGRGSGSSAEFHRCLGSSDPHLVTRRGESVRFSPPLALARTQSRRGGAARSSWPGAQTKAASCPAGSAKAPAGAILLSAALPLRSLLPTGGAG